jgi:rhodanese-related sulfurtransferase
MKYITTFPLFLLFVALLISSCAGAQAPVAESPHQIDMASLPLELTTQQVNNIRNNPDVVLIDVREQWEYDEGHIPNVKLIPLGSLPDRINEIPEDKFVVMTCRSGNRSGQATKFLREQGFDNVHNMAGGILAWQKAGLPVEK